MRLFFLLVFLVTASQVRAQSPIIDAYISTGDNHWLGNSLSIDSKQSIDDTMEFLHSACGVQRVYWRGLEEATWIQTITERPENCRYYSFWQWIRRLYREVDPDVTAVQAAKKRGMEVWGVGTLFDWGAPADTPGFGDYPFNCESRLRQEHPEWAPVDKHGYRRQGGPIELAYPEARAALVKLHVDEVLKAGYDGMTFLTYVENYAIRFQDEFGYSAPIVAEFKRRYKIDITQEAFTRYASKQDWYRLRGEYVTAYLRELKAELAKHNKKLGMFIGAHDIRTPQPWNVPEMMRTSGMIHFDLETWVKEQIVDLLMVNGNSSGQIQDAAVRECLWLTRDSSTSVTALSSSVHTDRWKPLQAKGMRMIISLNEDAHFAGRSATPEQTADALTSGDLARTCKALAQIIEGKLQAPASAIEPLAQTGNIIQRRLALQALSTLGKEGVPAITKALSDPETGIRCMAAQCLATAYDQDSAKALLKAVEDFGNHPLRESAVNTLLKMKPFPRELLTERALNSDNDSERIVCFRALSALAVAADLPTFQAAFKNGARYPRYLATMGMGNIRHAPAAVEELIKLLGHFDPVVANRAAVSLAHMTTTRNPALEPHRAAVIKALSARFLRYHHDNLYVDADWGWRVVGNALRDFGVTDPATVIGKQPDPVLARHAFSVWSLPQKNGSFSEVEESVNAAAFATPPPPLPPAHEPKTLVVHPSDGPYKTITTAIRAARPGDTIRLTPGTYYESVDFTDRSGAPGKPIAIDGQNSTIDGSDPVDLAGWENLGNDLYRKKNPSTPKLGKEVVPRFYLLFDGRMQRMGQCSKGSRAPFKKPGELALNEWTYIAEEDALYLRATASTAIRMPTRSNGLIVAGTCAHLVFKNFTATHVYNDGANIHGWCRDVTFENIRCIECGDDGVSAHDDCQITVNGLLCQGNATGITDVGDSVSYYRNVTIRDNIGFDLYFLGSNAHEVIDATVHTRAERAVVIDGQRDKAGPCTVLLKNVKLIREGEPQEIRVGANSVLTLQNVESTGLRVLATGGEIHIHDSSLLAAPDAEFLLWNDVKWHGDRNTYRMGSLRRGKTTYTARTFETMKTDFGSDKESKWVP